MKKDNALNMNELNNKKKLAEQNFGRKAKEIFGLFFVNYLYMTKINKINFVNEYYFTLKQIYVNLKELTTKLGIKNAKIQQDKDNLIKNLLSINYLFKKQKILIIFIFLKQNEPLLHIYFIIYFFQNFKIKYICFIIKYNIL